MNEAQEVSILDLRVGLSILKSELGLNFDPYAVGNHIIHAEARRLALYQKGYTINSAEWKGLELLLRHEAKLTFSHSRRLQSNIVKARNDKRPKRTHTHHIVGIHHARARIARDILFRNGIGINDADNGVYLPNSAQANVLSIPNGQPHPRTHTHVYYGNVNGAIQEANQDGAEGVRDALGYIAQKLQQGTYPVQKKIILFTLLCGVLNTVFSHRFVYDLG